MKRFERKKITEIALLISMKCDDVQDFVYVKACEAWINGTMKDRNILEDALNAFIEDYDLEEIAESFYHQDMLARELIDNFRESGEKDQMFSPFCE